VSFLRALRKLVLGETWLLPGAVALALGIAAAARGLAGAHGWWASGGGWLLLGLLAGGFCAAVLRSGRAR
jgi:hypothetical protein